MPSQDKAALFDKRREQALYQAAEARWKDGDEAGCQALLEQLLQQNPQHRAGRLMLADLYASQGKTADAEQLLRSWLQQNDDDAQAHHSLGLLLESLGRLSEALPHLERAVMLEPDTTAYLPSWEAALTAAAAPRPNTPQDESDPSQLPPGPATSSLSDAPQ